MCIALAGMGGTLSLDEVNVISGALEMTSKTGDLLLVEAKGQGKGWEGGKSRVERGYALNLSSRAHLSSALAMLPLPAPPLLTVARKAMTSIDKVTMVSDSCVLTEALVRQLMLTGHSRFPVYK